MAEVEGLIGEEKEETESVSGVAGADAVALAVAMDAARYDPELARKAGNYLDEQHLLVKLQVKHFDEERRLAIAAAKRKRYADRIRNALATFFAAVAGVLVIAAIVIVWNARSDHGLLVEAFSVPSDFEQKGISGRVIAAELIDQINILQSHTRTSRPAGSYRNNWGDDIKVEIPETGISIGELARMLHDKLGHPTRIEGDVIRTATGLTVAARIHDDPAVKASGPQSNLDDLIHDVAEQIYAVTQPYLYANKFFNENKDPEALAVFRSLTGAPVAGSIVIQRQFLPSQRIVYGLFARMEFGPAHHLLSEVCRAFVIAQLARDVELQEKAVPGSGRCRELVALCQDLINGLRQPGIALVNQEQIQRRVYPLLALALARLGHEAESDALLNWRLYT